jgi:hypothetical protein
VRGSARPSIRRLYRHFAETGAAPTRDVLASLVGDLDTVDDLLRELHDRHMLVLDDRPHRQGEIRMALPFAAEPTNFRVSNDRGSWWANCAWDSLAIFAALRADGRIESTWSDTGDPPTSPFPTGDSTPVMATSTSPFPPANGATTSW